MKDYEEARKIATVILKEAEYTRQEWLQDYANKKMVIVPMDVLNSLVLAKPDDSGNGFCRRCDSNNLQYSEIKTIPNGIVYPYVCENCGHQGGAVYKTVFEGME